jgi:vitamin B12 transporter
MQRLFPLLQAYLFLFSCTLLISNPLTAAGSLQLSGTVKDPSGATVPGAKISWQGQQGDPKISFESDEQGHFTYSGRVQSGGKITVLADGFKPFIKQYAAGSTLNNLEIQLEFVVLQTNLVVSATRTAAPADNLGASVTLISREELQLSQSASIPDVLRDVPGFTVMQTGGRGGVTSLFSRGGESDFNKVLFDGFPLNDLGGGFNFAHLTTFDVERVEAMQGPSSALFGSDAIASVVQMFSRRGATTRPEVELQAEGGSYGLFREAASLSGLFNRLDYAASVENWNSQGRYVNDDYRNTVFGGNWGWQINGKSTLRAIVHYGTSELGVPGPVRAWNDMGYTPDPDHRDRQTDLLLGVSFEQRIREDWDQRFSYYHMESGQHSFDPGGQNPQDYPLDFYNHPRRRGFQYQTTARLPFHNLLSGGAEYEFEDGAIDTLKVNRRNLGLYFQDQWTLGERLHIVAGGRIDHNSAPVPEAILASRASQGLTTPENSGYGTVVTPRVSVSYFLLRPRGQSFFEGTRLKFNFAQGIKEPKLIESFSPYPSYLGNPELRPERSTSFEAGVVQSFSRGLDRLEITGYDNQYKDLVDYKMISFDPTTWEVLGTYINSEKTRARGVETSLFFKPLSNFQFSAHYNYAHTHYTASQTRPQDPVVAGGLSLLRRPKHSASAVLSYSKGRFQFYFRDTYVGARNDVNPDVWGYPAVLPNSAYNRLDLGLSARLHARATWFARIDNLSNREYEEVLGYPAYRINFSSGLKIRLGGK